MGKKKYPTRRLTFTQGQFLFLDNYIRFYDEFSHDTLFTRINILESTLFRSDNDTQMKRRIKKFFDNTKQRIKKENCKRITIIKREKLKGITTTDIKIQSSHITYEQFINVIGF